MAKTIYKGVEEARNQLPGLLEEAARGHATVITRRGKQIAALVPLETYGAAGVQQPLLALEGSSRGLWGRDPTAQLRRLRDEWSR